MTTKNFVVKNGLTTGNIILSAANSNISANTVVANLQVPSRANLGAAGNITITGGTNGQVLTTDGNGGLSWANAGTSTGSNASFVVDKFTGSGTQTNFTLTSTPASVNNIIVNYNGAFQLQNAYTLEGSTLTFTESPESGAKIEVFTLTGSGAGGGGGGNANVAGSNTQIQYNNNGSLGASANFTYNNSTNTLGVNNISVTGNIIPTVSNVYSLGSANYVFKDVFIGPGSLYVDGQKVLQSAANTIIFSADLDQNLRVSTTGTGDIELLPSGSGSIAIKGPLQIQSGKSIISSDGNPVQFSSAISVDSITSKTTNSDFTLTANGTGNVKVDDNLVVTGNIVIQGTTGNLSVTSLSVQDNIIDINSEQTGTPSGNSGIRVIRGDEAATQLRYTETVQKWQVTNDGSTYIDIVGTFSNGTTNLSNAASANYFIGNGYYLTGISGGGGTNYSNANVAAYLPTYTGNVSANYFIGNGSALTYITGGNVNGQVANALISGTVYTNAQPNITSVGTLSSLTVSGNVSAGNILGNGYYLSGIYGSNVIGVVASATSATSATTAGTVTSNAQPNITSVGTLNGLTATGTVNFTSASNVSLGSNANIKITGGSANYVLQTDGTGNLSWTAQSGGGGGGGASNARVMGYNLVFGL